MKSDNDLISTSLVKQWDGYLLSVYRWPPEGGI